MPSTITAFYEFTPGTKARSSEVNTNFSNYRGDIVPINTATATASHLTHNLGTYEHRWLAGYFGSVDIGGATTTSDLIIANSGTTLGGANLKIESTTLGHFSFGEFGFSGHTTTEYTRFKYQTTTGGNFDLLRGSSTLSSWTSQGLTRLSLEPINYTSASAPTGYALFTGVTSVSALASATMLSARITTVGGRMLEVMLANHEVKVSNYANSYIAGQLNYYRGTTTTAMTLVASAMFNGGCNAAGFTTPTACFPYFIDTGYSAGEVVIELRTAPSSGNTGTSSANIRGALFVREL